MKQFEFSLERIRNYKMQMLEKEKKTLASLKLKRDEIAQKIYSMEKFRDEIRQKEDEYIEIKQQKEDAKQDDTEKIKSVVQDFLSLSKPTSEIMKVIINRIEIHQDKQVDLYFNFKQLNNLKEKI